MFIEWAMKGKPSLLGLVSGVVAGLVAITPAAGFAHPGTAILLGAVVEAGEDLLAQRDHALQRHHFGGINVQADGIQRPTRTKYFAQLTYTNQRLTGHSDRHTHTIP